MNGYVRRTSVIALEPSFLQSYMAMWRPQKMKSARKGCQGKAFQMPSFKGCSCIHIYKAALKTGKQDNEVVQAQDIKQ